MKNKFKMWKPGQIVTSVYGDQYRVTKSESASSIVSSLFIAFFERSVCAECIARKENGNCISWSIKDYNKKMPDDCNLTPLKPKQRR